ncbi:MAG: ABC transporter substrate-binding protein [Proteobacteria bacterium]|nr:ABC transporter substrate-binding protein [Pseudomonadota bacterium]MBI3497151.1 ABC transporter substrate-binding protein [Pseudomonadota bacterium]
MRTVMRAAAIAATLLIGCGNADAASTVVTDALGRKVTISTPVNRVIVNFHFEDFTAVAGVEGWKKVVGMSRSLWSGSRAAIFNRYKAVIQNLADIPEIGNYEDNDLSIERIIALKPDVFLVAEFTFSAMKDDAEKIEAAGIPIVVIDYNAQLLERHLASTRALGKVMGQEARAEELATLYESRYRDVMARAEKANAKGGLKPKVYFEVGQLGAGTVGNTFNGTNWGKIFDLMGAQNIAAGKLPGPFGKLNPEFVIAANPDEIFIAGSSWLNRPTAVKTGYDATEELTRSTLAPYAARPGWADLKAVKSGNFYAIEMGLARTMFDYVAMEFIGKRLYPDEFRDVDPTADLRAYHEKYLPVAYAGNWWVTLKP